MSESLSKLYYVRMCMFLYMFMCSYVHVYELRLSLNLVLSVYLWEGHPDSLSSLQVRIKADSGPVKLSWGVKISSNIRFKALGGENSFGRWK